MKVLKGENGIWDWLVFTLGKWGYWDLVTGNGKKCQKSKLIWEWDLSTAKWDFEKIMGLEMGSVIPFRTLKYDNYLSQS